VFRQNSEDVECLFELGHCVKVQYNQVVRNSKGASFAELCGVWIGACLPTVIGNSAILNFQVYFLASSLLSQA
jgi:hypothetical protein